jgi:hypothetical protein
LFYQPAAIAIADRKAGFRHGCPKCRAPGIPPFLGSELAEDRICLGYQASAAIARLIPAVIVRVATCLLA